MYGTQTRSDSLIPPIHVFFVFLKRGPNRSPYPRALSDMRGVMITYMFRDRRRYLSNESVNLIATEGGGDVSLESTSLVSQGNRIFAPIWDACCMTASVRIKSSREALRGIIRLYHTA
eukprot:GHVO01016660.1.p2 GENE.GHVO01016660.1~~GHVO01016660.1.p2  ORF type:complete len:118 (-),score=22.78 GHVO01016660.1:198-551(-)